MRIGIFGLGYVGSTSMACLAELGHDVTGVDINAEKAAMINAGESPIFEPHLGEMLRRLVAAGRVRAVTQVDDALAGCDAALICVGTPSSPQGTLDPSHLRDVVEGIARERMRTGRIVPMIVRSTALPEIHRQMIAVVEGIVGGSQPIAYCVHPEFLRAGQAIDDFMNPPKIIFGCTDDAARNACRELYPEFALDPVFTDPMTAALVKYADNSFHAVKVTFANEVGMASRAMGVDAREVMKIFCLDTKLNISAQYLRPGFAFGGSCLPKDLRALIAWSRQNMVALPMLEHVLPSNGLQVERVMSRMLESGHRTVGIFGLAFKENTDDLRESPVVTLAEHLLGKGMKIKIYDPALSVPRMIGTNRAAALRSLPHLAEMLTADPAAVVSDSDIIVITRIFRDLDWASLPWRREQRVLDLVGANPLPRDRADIEGIYWDQ